MEEKKEYGTHRIIVTNREEMAVSGVVDVISFDEESVVVETEMGMLEIKGMELHVSQLNLENGEMSLSGDISSVEYDDKATYGKGGASLISRLFG